MFDLILLDLFDLLAEQIIATTQCLSTCPDNYVFNIEWFYDLAHSFVIFVLHQHYFQLVQVIHRYLFEIIQHIALMSVIVIVINIITVATIAVIVLTMDDNNIMIIYIPIEHFLLLNFYHIVYQYFLQFDIISFQIHTIVFQVVLEILTHDFPKVQLDH